MATPAAARPGCRPAPSPVRPAPRCVFGFALGDPQATVQTKLLLDTAPTLIGGGGTGPNTSIVPWMLGGQGTTLDQLVTYVPGTGRRCCSSFSQPDLARQMNFFFPND